MTRVTRAGVFAANSALRSTEETTARIQELQAILTVANEAEKRAQLEEFIAQERNYINRNRASVTTTQALATAERALMGLNQDVPAFTWN